MQVVRQKRLRKFPEKKLQGSSNYCGIIAALKCPPLILVKGIFQTLVNFYLVQLSPNLLDLVLVPWNSVESVSLKVFLL